GKTLVGLVENIEIKGNVFKAKIDTGAAKSSIDVRLAAKLGLGPIIGYKGVRSVSGRGVRPVINIHFKIRGRKMCYSFNVTDRKKMMHKVLIGQNILRKNFLIDPSLLKHPAKK
ncbi:MAG: RimK/LysX family protein, partial [Nanoarchaeota archaeon]|nr:RimK/LysX family protein [Nanoarchaeota archaeon]